MEAALGPAAVVGTTVEETNSTTGTALAVTKIPANLRGFSSLIHTLIITFVPFTALTSLVIAVTLQASVTPHSGRMTGAAGCVTMVDTGSLFIQPRLRM